MIFHIAERAKWVLAKDKGLYVAPSIDTEGFIHASTSAQVLGVANFLFAGKDDLVLLAIDPHRLKAPLVFEGPSSNKFPHIYGPLNLEAVIKVFEFKSGSQGFENLPDGVDELAHNQLAEHGKYIGATADLQEPNSENTYLDADFGRKLHLKNLGVHHITLYPSQQTSLPHCESDEEEFVLVLKGRPHIWLNGYIYEGLEMDAVAFPSATGISHCVINNTDQNVELLVVGERTKPHNKWYNPLHPEKQTQDNWWEEAPKHELGPNSGKPGDLTGFKKRNERPEYFKSVFEFGYYPPFAYTVAGVKDKETMCSGVPFGRKMGLKKLGIGLERIEVGKRTSWPHCHMKEDEFGFVISGHPSAWLEGYLHRLNPQDGVAFPAGVGIAHTILNESDEDCYLIAIGEASPQPPEIDEDRIIYPLHPARNADVKLENCLWEDHPVRVLGPHNGIANPPLKKEFYLESDRLKFRRLKDSDLDGLIRLDTDPEVMRYLSDGVPSPVHEIKANLGRIQFRNSKLKKFGIWAAELKSTGEFIGWFCLKPLPGSPNNEIGYRLLKKFWGQGFATEGATRIRDYGFEEAGLDIIAAITHVKNEVSAKVLKKIGMKIIKQMDFYNEVLGITWPVDYWEMTRKSTKLH